jgi:hypothetical protein
MTKITLLGAAALVLSSTLASPIMAQDAPRGHAQKQMHMSQHRMHQQRHTASRNDNMARRNIVRRNDDMAYRNDPNGWNNNGFWPGAVAAGAVGGALATADAAVNTAGAIATAPFRGADSYAYYSGGPNNGWNGYGPGWNGQTYGQRNGFVCQPGTWFKGDDGLQHPCQ